MRAACAEVAMIIAVLMLPGLTHGAQPPASASCSLDVQDTIDLVVGDEVDVPVEIEGRAGVMGLDLSSPVSWLDEGALAGLGLKLSYVALESRNGQKALTKVAGFKSLKVGESEFGAGSLRARGTPRRSQSGSERRFGTLGTDFFREVDFELDLSRKRLNLFSQDHCAGEAVYWADEWGTAPLMTGPGGTFYFAPDLQGKKVEATFAPAEPLTQLRTDVAKRLYGVQKSSAEQTTMFFSASPVSVKAVQVRLADAAAPPCTVRERGHDGRAAGYEGCADVYPVTLGRDVLSQLRLFFAIKEKTLYFTPSNATLSRKMRAQ
jgi:hypothetical protein